MVHFIMHHTRKANEVKKAVKQIARTGSDGNKFPEITPIPNTVRPTVPPADLISDLVALNPESRITVLARDRNGVEREKDNRYFSIE
jgi:hypothetical protein